MSYGLRCETFPIQILLKETFVITPSLKDPLEARIEHLVTGDARRVGKLFHAPGNLELPRLTKKKHEGKNTQTWFYVIHHELTNVPRSKLDTLKAKR